MSTTRKATGVTVERRIDCQSDPEDLWDLLTDTNRLNHAQGLEPFAIEPIKSGRERNRVRTGFGPLKVEFVEEPMEWVRPQYFKNPRRMTKGPIAWTETYFELQPKQGGGCVVLIRGTIAPRWAFLKPLVKIGLNPQMDKVARVVAGMDALVQSRADHLFTVPHPASVNGAALTTALEATQAEIPGSDEVLTRLEALLRSGSDVELSRIRPFEVADDWGLDRRLVLETFLAASVNGLLDLRWELVCPSCKTMADEVPSLSEIEEHSACALCDLTFGVSLDSGVEVTFQPNAAVRSVPALQFCTGGPGRTPHVLVQYNISTGTPVKIPIPAETGRYRLFARGGATASVAVEDDADDAATVHLSKDAFDPAAIRVRPGATVTVEQTEGGDRHVKLERVEWASRAATALFVNTLPAFRRLFSHEVLRPGLALRVSRAALVFTDLSGSTALYTDQGDAVAFRLVQDHFELLADAIAKNDGAIVKTIGDAIMASFIDEADAVRAAVEMQRVFAEFRERSERNKAVALKVGVYAGACYAVTANGILDYFGQSVNVAARLEGQAQKGQIVMTKELEERATQAGWLDGAHVVEELDATLKGIDEPVPVVRLEL